MELALTLAQRPRKREAVVSMNKVRSKADYPQTEVEITSDIREALSAFTPEEIESGVVSGGRPVPRDSHTFQDLKELYEAAKR